MSWKSILLGATLSISSALGIGHAQVIVYPGDPPAVCSGTYVVASLPNPAQAKCRYAFVSDLGGGADMVLTDGTNWKHIRQGILTDVAGGNTINITPLASPPMIRVTGTSLTTTSVNISQTNLYPGYVAHIVFPGALAVAATFGVSVGGAGSLPMVGGSWADFQWNGSSLVKIAGGTL